MSSDESGDSDAPIARPQAVLGSDSEGGSVRSPAEGTAAAKTLLGSDSEDEGVPTPAEAVSRSASPQSPSEPVAGRKRAMLESDSDAEQTAAAVPSEEDFSPQRLGSPAGSKADSDVEEAPTATAGTLFGEEMSSDEEDATSPQADALEERTINIEMPYVKTDLGRQIFYVKLPNFLSIEQRPFDPDYYEDEQMDDVLDEEGRARIKMKIENSIRWAYRRDVEGNIEVDEFGQQRKISNSRVIRWDDGSMSLHVGSEVFDMHVLAEPADHNHLYVRQGNGLVGQAVFKNKLNFRPHSTESMTHRKMTMSMAEKSNRVNKVKILSAVSVNPEAGKAALIKADEQALRALASRDSGRRKVKERAHSKGMTATYLEDDDDNTFNVRKMKEAARSRVSQSHAGTSKADLSPDTSDVDSEEEAPVPAGKSDSEPEKSEAESSSSSSLDSTAAPPVSARTKRKVFSSSSEEDDD